MILGTCSICGGPVTVSDYYHSLFPPVPRCDWCGATKEQPYGPVIPMTPKRPYIEVDGEEAERRCYINTRPSIVSWYL